MHPQHAIHEEMEGILKGGSLQGTKIDTPNKEEERW